MALAPQIHASLAFGLAAALILLGTAQVAQASPSPASAGIVVAPAPVETADEISSPDPDPLDKSPTERLLDNLALLSDFLTPPPTAQAPNASVVVGPNTSAAISSSDPKISENFLPALVSVLSGLGNSSSVASGDGSGRAVVPSIPFIGPFILASISLFGIFIPVIQLFVELFFLFFVFGFQLFLYGLQMVGIISFTTVIGIAFFFCSAFPCGNAQVTTRLGDAFEQSFNTLLTVGETASPFNENYFEKLGKIGARFSTGFVAAIAQAFAEARST